MYKRIAIIVVPVLFSFLFWFLAKPWVENLHKFSDIDVWLWPLVILICAASTASLAYALLPQRRLGLIIATCIGAGYLGVFGWHWLNLIAAGLIVVFHAVSIRYTHSEITSRVTLDVNRIVRHGMGYILVSMLLAISFGYFLSPSVQERARTVTVPPTFREIASKTFDAFLKTEDGSAYEKQQIKNEALTKLYDLYERQLSPYTKYFPPVLAFGLFIGLWGSSFILIPLSVWVAYLLFLLLRTTGFVSLTKEMVEAERIKL